jgi:hypothetical protein
MVISGDKVPSSQKIPETHLRLIVFYKRRTILICEVLQELLYAFVSSKRATQVRKVEVVEENEYNNLRQ